MFMCMFDKFRLTTPGLYKEDYNCAAQQMLLTYVCDAGYNQPYASVSEVSAQCR